MQRNPGFPSIEEEIERALVKAGAIPEALAGSFVGVRAPRGGWCAPACFKQQAAFFFMLAVVVPSSCYTE